MKNPFLIGRAIYLRPLEVADAAIVQPWFNDPDVRRTLTMYRPISLQGEEAFIRALGDNPHTIVLVIVHKELDRPIGVCDLRNIDFKNGNAMFGISIGESLSFRNRANSSTESVSPALSAITALTVWPR